jgi:Mg2+ and Co2+ transporter CorA
VYLKHVNMTKDVLQSLTAVLFNRIDKSDSQSMKTIAVVTLLFLPATFVSSVFSTGIFDFHAGEPADAPRVVSSYGWVYLLVCLLATVLAVLLWTFWYLWGGAWLDGLRRPEQSGGSGGFVTLKTLETSGRTRLPYLGRRKP